MGFTAKRLAEGITTTGTATVITVPAATTYHIIFMSIRGNVNSDDFNIIFNNGTDRIVAKYSVPTGGEPADASAPSSTGMAGSVGNLIMETGDILKIARTSGTGEAEFVVSGYDIDA